MTRPRLLDLFCGAGGAAMGYHRAGFDVIGVDIVPQPRYPFEFLMLDAMEVLATWDMRGFDAIHASPPCQVYSAAAASGTRRIDGHPDLVPPVRVLLRQTGLPYVIENVPGAPMPSAVLLCGSMFRLPVVRHRLFEISPDPVLWSLPKTCPQKSTLRAVAHRGAYGYAQKTWEPNWRKHVLPVVWPWMSIEESGQAIPPAYTEYIGRQLL